MARSLRLRLAALVLSNLLLPVAVLVFASGFFPYKPFLPGLATFGDVLDDVATAQQPPAIFDRVVFMVVDALRSDFVYGRGSNFEFTQSLIRSGAAIPFTAHATPPTVTMPRVKALTTGSVPSFLDFILNFAESDTTSSLAAQDTWLAQIRARGGQIVFYGDDTWLKLFPGDAMFARTDGTSSFFVSDFTEVDNNVTRHVGPEIARADWSAMIMHYLGLDHIGHKTGPQGPNMMPKQREMDNIVRSIYTAMESDPHHLNTLLVLAGDHGMNAGGNHGGSGPGETEPALLFASPKFRSMERREQYESPTTPKDGTEFHFYAKVEQSDFVPSLAGLMGFPIPRNSLGIFIPELTGFWPVQQRLQLLRQNAEQLRQIIEATYGAKSWDSHVASYRNLAANTPAACSGSLEGEDELGCLWTHMDDISVGKLIHEDADQAQRSIFAFLLAAQRTLSGTASSYDLPRMFAGMLLAAIIVILSVISMPALWPPSTASVFFATVCALYAVLMFGSSYVEEEQHFWFWLTPAWILVLTVISLTRSHNRKSHAKIFIAAAALLAVHRIAVRWNQTGQKHAGEPDIARTFFPQAHLLLWILILVTYACNGLMLIQRAFGGIVSHDLAVLAALVLIAPAVVFKLNFTQADSPELVQGLALQLRMWSEPAGLVLQARMVFALLAVTTVAVIAFSIASARASRLLGLKEIGLLPSLAERLHHLLTLFLMMQTRATNIPLFLGMEIQRAALSYLLSASAAPPPESSHSPGARHAMRVAPTALLLSHVYFFCMGQSNSVSSLDLSNAYNGVVDYNIAAVGVLLFASNWTGPIWWSSAAVLLLAQRQTQPLSPPPSSTTQSNGTRSWIDNERKKLIEDSRAGPSQTAPAAPASWANRGIWMVYMSSMTAFVAVGLVGVMAACTALRSHLFIWTVFSPKYLYAAAWSMGWHLVINLGMGSVWAHLTSIA